MHDLNDLYFFAKVVERGSFAAASRALDIPKSRLSRRVAQLEERLGARLLQRTTRKLALTDVGQRYYERCQAMLLEADAAEATVASLRDEPSGRLRVSCPVGIAYPELAPVLPAFLRQHPAIQLELMVTNRRVDLLEEGVDVALRVREAGQQDPNLVTRRFRTGNTLLVASPALLERYPPINSPEDLAGLPTMNFGLGDRGTHWRLTGPDGEQREVVIEPVFHCDDFYVLKHAALAGMGLTTMPETYCIDEIEHGELLPVIPHWRLPEGIVHGVYPSRRGLSPAVKAFMDFLSLHLGRVSG
ncbi:LysR substrate-binding domain-containing protein [Chitinivorax sp. PXF-14]|uniref:LysR substrate-binding domain-containing protein n=1 Tax=Chitinivorax sp. PXF-14 TaxID=3230488 RepID=UPI003465BB59